MQLSIRFWTVLALNALVLAVSLLQGWIAQDVAGKVVEERIAKEMTASVSAFLADKSFPLSNTMMGYLREILNEDWVAVRGEELEIVGSSLSEPLTHEFQQRIREVGAAGMITLGGDQYRIDSNDVPVARGKGPIDSNRLYVLIPNTKLQEARGRASMRVASGVLPSTIVATLMAMLLAFGITHPVRKLAHEMDRLAAGGQIDAGLADATLGGQAALEPGSSEQRRFFTSTGPKEARRLAKSFYALLDRLAETRHRLIQNDRLATLGKICLSVAHELRNPLSGIKMNMRVLQDRLGPTDNPGVEAILREIDRMGLYLDELMTLAPATRQPERLAARSQVKLSELANSVLTILAGRCRHANVSVKKDYPTAEPSVLGEPNQIRQAMMNFIVNAIEAMPSGGTMTVSVRPRSSTIAFQVGDTGPGVQGDDRHVFEAFSTSKPNGAGLGLYLSRQIVLGHGGRIGYDNATVGAVFWFELPIVPADPRGEPEPTT